MFTVIAHLGTKRSATQEATYECCMRVSQPATGGADLLLGYQFQIAQPGPSTRLHRLLRRIWIGYERLSTFL